MVSKFHLSTRLLFFQKNCRLKKDNSLFIQNQVFSHRDKNLNKIKPLQICILFEFKEQKKIF